MSPSGGGLRSFYGKWTQERWLRSYISKDLLKNPQATATVFQQHYRKNDKDAELKKNSKGRKRKKKQTLNDTTGKADNADTKETIQEIQGDKVTDSDEKLNATEHFPTTLTDSIGYPLVTQNKTYPDQTIYDRRDPYYKITAKTDSEFLYQIPQEDPYRQFDQSLVDGGYDARWIWLALQEHSDPEVKKATVPVRNFLMNLDLNLRYRPIRRHFHLVYEGRILGMPSQNPVYSSILASAGTRSLYAMVDNLPFNIYAQGGLYRPLFGNYIPDHNHLSQKMFAWAITGARRSQAVTFQAASLGTAPNVPFANIHYIGGVKTVGNSDPVDNTQGFAFNGGLRFVSFGGNVNYSFWQTEKKAEGGHFTKLQMHGFGLMATFFNRLTQGFDIVTIERDDMPIDFRSGAVISSETYLRIFREKYLTFHYSYANRTVDLLPGTGQQIKAGVRAFILPGVEISSTIDRDEQKASQPDLGTSVTSTVLTSQVHLFF